MILSARVSGIQKGPYHSPSCCCTPQRFLLLALLITCSASRPVVGWTLFSFKATERVVGYKQSAPIRKDLVPCYMVEPTTTTNAMVTTTSQPLLLSLSHHLGGSCCTNEKDDANTCRCDIHLILASQSPRRQEIFDMMGLRGRFHQAPSPLDETALQQRLLLLDDEERPLPTAYVRILAEEKAKALAEQMAGTVTKPTLVLGSDTVVDVDGQILEKPRDEAEAKTMLQWLSGRQHAVHTGVAVHQVLPNNNNKYDTTTLVDSFTDTALVSFAQLSNKDIDAYIATKEPMDKAGSYGIQGIGGQFVSRIEGDFFTVMGLPMHRTSQMLAQAVSNIILS